MAVQMIRAWRGNNRGRMKAGIRNLTGLLNYNTKHANAGLFTAVEAGAVQTVVSILEQKLLLQRPR